MLNLIFGIGANVIYCFPTTLKNNRGADPPFDLVISVLCIETVALSSEVYTNISKKINVFWRWPTLMWI